MSHQRSAVFSFLRQGLTCNPGCPGTHNSPALVSWVLRLQIALGFTRHFEAACVTWKNTGTPGVSPLVCICVPGGPAKLQHFQ
jgi:hypothetical protein